MTSVLFRNAALVDGTSTEVREGFDLLVEDDRIKEISDQPIQTANAGCRSIDLAGAVLMPGLIDAHVHVKATRLDLGHLHEVPSAYLVAQAGQILRDMLMRGFTTVRDAAGADRGLADAVADGLLVGPRMFVSGLALSQTGGHGDFRTVNTTASVITCACQVSTLPLGRIADGVDECRRAARDELRKGAHQLKIMAGGGVASPADPVQNTQYSQEEVSAIVAEAAAWRTYVMAHAYTPHAIQRVISCGVRSIEHGNLLDEETARQMAQANVFHVPTNITYTALNRHGREFGFAQASLDKLQEIVAHGLRAVELADAAGVAIAHGSDLLGPCHRYQADELSLKAEVLGNHGAIKSATMTSADLLNCTGEIGVLAVGAKADLLVVNGNPLDDIGVLENQGRDIAFIMRDGILFKET